MVGLAVDRLKRSVQRYRYGAEVAIQHRCGIGVFQAVDAGTGAGSLVVAEEEKLVLQNRPANIRPELIVVQRIDCMENQFDALSSGCEGTQTRRHETSLYPTLVSIGQLRRERIHTWH